MAWKTKSDPKRPIESYEHRDKERLNNPPAGLVTPETDPDAGQRKRRYAYDPHLDPQLVWAGKAEHTSFEVPTVSLHVHERIEPRTIIEAVRKRNGNSTVCRRPSRRNGHEFNCFSGTSNHTRSDSCETCDPGCHKTGYRLAGKEEEPRGRVRSL
jgi:hypothetical protein